jgi:hypothetical protein
MINHIHIPSPDGALCVHRKGLCKLIHGKGAKALMRGVADRYCTQEAVQGGEHWDCDTGLPTSSKHTNFKIR